jgi:AP-4 complex subunit beta-1
MSSSEVSNTHELTFVILSHIKFIVQRGENADFSRECKRFYCKVDEPSYIQFLKLDILAYVADMENLGNIMNELSVYVQEINNLLSRKAIETFGKIASRI